METLRLTKTPIIDMIWDGRGEQSPLAESFFQKLRRLYGPEPVACCNETIAVYCNDSSPYILKWPILNNFTINDDQQDAFADAFTDYLWAQKESEGN